MRALLLRRDERFHLMHTAPAVVKLLLAIAWTVMAAFILNLLLSFWSWRYDFFDEYVGRFSWIAYLWIASVTFWRSSDQRERRAMVRFVGWVLWLAIGMGAMDFAWFGWSSHEAGSIFTASPWRLLSYWVLPPLFLVLLRLAAVSQWVSGEADPRPSAANS